MTATDNFRVQSPGCEVNAVHHCNLSCRGCSHLSPVIPKSFADPKIVYRDLSQLGAYYSARHVRLLGGEPLLHHNLLELIAATRAAGITECIRILTNGILLPSAPEEFWESVDEIQVSLYTGAALDHPQLQRMEDAARDHGVKLEIREFTHFREPYSEVGTPNDQLVRRVFETCQIAHIWQCHTIYNGRFYLCPQTVFLRAVLTDAHLPEEGLLIDSRPDFSRRLKEYIERDIPFVACSYCLGSVGKLYPHELIARRQWRQRQTEPTENLLDFAYLERLEADPREDFGCITNIHRSCQPLVSQPS
jgi:organic radical activating enzyme